MSRYLERVPAEPVVRWLEHRYQYHHGRLGGTGFHHGKGAAQALANELFPRRSEDAALRSLYRFRAQRLESRRIVNGRRVDHVEQPCEAFAREAVEEMLHAAGLGLRDIYGPWIDEHAGRRGAAREVLRFVYWVEQLADVFDDSLLPEFYCPECGRYGAFDLGASECLWCQGQREFAELRQKRQLDQAWKLRREAA